MSTAQSNVTARQSASQPVSQPASQPNKRDNTRTNTKIWDALVRVADVLSDRWHVPMAGLEQPEQCANTMSDLHQILIIIVFKPINVVFSKVMTDMFSNVGFMMLSCSSVVRFVHNHKSVPMCVQSCKMF